MAMKHWFKQAAAQSNSQRTARARAIRQRQRDLTERLLRLECLEARLVLASDFGDAPDLAIGVGPGNYNTLASNNGPSHTIVAGIKLGANVDGDSGTLQNAAANADDVNGALPDDEDGLVEPGQDLTLTVGTAPQVRVRATNTTGADATLYGWIDINRNGAFDNATERASVIVPTGTTNGTFTLTFPTIPLSASAGQTYARFRLSTDAAAADATGAAADGEVEDYVASITKVSTGVADPAKLAKISRGSKSFGQSMASLGDLDGDGVTDLAVAAPLDDTGGGPYGVVNILFLNVDGTVKNVAKIDDATNGFLQGRSVASLGDLDGDGVTDLAVGTPNDGGSGRGAVHVLFLNANGSVKNKLKIGFGYNGGPILASYDRFGSSVASLGDVDGDGVTDLAVGAIGDDTGGYASNRGAVHVLFLNANGTVKNKLKIANNTNGGPTLANNSSFGYSVASLGDFDGDGVPDLSVAAGGGVYLLFLNANGSVKNSLIASATYGGSMASVGDLDGDGVTDLAVGAAGDDTGGLDRGAVHVLYLNANGTVKSSLKIADNTNGGPTLANGDLFGWSVASLGDLDGDGATDLAVGAISDDTGGLDRGAVHVLFLNANGSVKNAQKIASTGTVGLTFSPPGDLFGTSVASLGDLDGDGVTDLAVGAIFDGTGGTKRGAVYVVFLKADGTVKSSLKIADNTNGGPTLANNDYFGGAVASVGDLDGDGVTDLAVGAKGDDTDGFLRGAVYVLFLNADGTVKSSLKIANNTNGGPILADGDQFGASVASLGDLDGDGVTELAVGAGANAGGAVHMLFLNANGTVKNKLKIASTTNGGPLLADGDSFGSSVASLGDLDGDGVTDLAVGAAGDDTGGNNRGAIYMLFLNVDGTAKNNQKIASSLGGAPPLGVNGQFGVSLAPLGDFDGDGITDLAVGANLAFNGGAVHVLFLKPAALLGDVNHDGVVNIFDINLVSSHWGEAGPLGDANDDHIVNIFDINLISANWSPSPGGGSGLAAGADEPGSAESGSAESGSAESPLRMPTADLVEPATSANPVADARAIAASRDADGALPRLTASVWHTTPPKVDDDFDHTDNRLAWSPRRHDEWSAQVDSTIPDPAVEPYRAKLGDARLRPQKSHPLRHASLPVPAAVDNLAWSDDFGLVATQCAEDLVAAIAGSRPAGSRRIVER